MSQTVNAVEWQNILKLIMLTMLSDGRAYERQADTFVDTSVKLRADLSVRGFQTRQMTMEWYIQNRKELVEIQTGKTFENDLLALIDSIDTIPNKKPLLRAIKNLSVRDSEQGKHSAGIATKLKTRWA